MSDKPKKTLSPEQLEKMVTEAVARALSNATSTKVEEVKEVKEEQVDETVALKERLERAEAMVNKLLEEPVRNGRHPSNDFMRTHLTKGGAFVELCSIERSNGNTALPTFIENNLEKINEAEIGKMKLHDLKDLLESGLRAAEADGYFNN